MRAPSWLHVAAMPFPTRQGTQTAIAAMCAASATAGRETHLLAYAAGEGARAAPFTVHRVGDFPRFRSLRSGPSAAKVALDARMAFDFARLRRRLRPDVLVAHHVEAGAVVAGTTAARRFVLFQHTDLGAELPSYAPALLARPLALAGRVADRSLARRALGVAAISPALAERVRRAVGPDVPVRWVPVPWSLPPSIDDGARARAREALGLGANASTVLYAGNLDVYQGLDAVVGALAKLAPRMPGLRWLVGTASDAAALAAEAMRAGIGDRLHVVALGEETTRRWLHAAADVVVVPRRTPGGLPIKLLDALSRGSACVCAPDACAGLPLDGAVSVASANEAGALAQALERALGSRERRESLGAAGRAYVAREHDATRFLAALDALAGPRDA